MSESEEIGKTFSIYGVISSHKCVPSSTGCIYYWVVVTEMQSQCIARPHPCVVRPVRLHSNNNAFFCMHLYLQM